MIIGIDPGLTGAIVAVDEMGILSIHDMPVSPRRIGKGNEVNAYLLADRLAELSEYRKVVIWLEAVSSMPGQGVTGVFAFGRSTGVIEGVAAGLGLRVEYVRPQTWKKHFGLIGKPKDASRTLAIARHPKHAQDFARKKDTGRADALLIAEYGLTGA